ncbi:3-dehydroquinate synthase [Calditerrivibrio sp.]|uniref:3-dehydroquinate synthase n=1 Tax=Calditerrivibrio sp. TaxID=2792612 RepID=UPI003D1409AC
MEKVHVNLNYSKYFSYDILIDHNFVDNELRGIANYNRAHLVVDKNVCELYNSFFVGDIFILNSSEHNKNLNTVYEILNFMKNRKALRNDTLFAVGGGIVGDVAGFAASIYMRGINFIQVPTTLLSMVDSSVGGKTGVNLGDVKNLVGSFYQPKKVLIDTLFLTTLPEDEFKSGLAEVIKYALLFDKDLYEFLISNKTDVVKRREDVIIKIIKRCCELKAKVVEEDETEQGIRKLLNLGHTFGHAIEVDSDHEIKHGIAVAKGIYLEALFAYEKGMIGKNVLDDIEKIFEIYDYDLNYQVRDFTLFINAIGSDKKAMSSGIVLALTSDVGSGIIKSGIDLDSIKKFFEGARWMRPQ